MHGLTRNSHDFDYIAPAIAGFHNYVVYALDVVGRGRSDYLTAGEESYGYAIYVKVRLWFSLSRVHLLIFPLVSLFLVNRMLSASFTILE